MKVSREDAAVSLPKKDTLLPAAPISPTVSEESLCKNMITNQNKRFT